MSEGLKRLDACRKDHVAAYDEALKTNPGLDALVRLDPHFMLTLVDEYMLHVSAEPIAAGSAVPPPLGSLLHLCDLLVRVFPGCTEGLFCLARAHYLQANFDEALHTIAALLARAETSGRADDADPAVIQKRIDVYNAETAPVADHYRAAGKYQGIDGVGSIEAITQRLTDAIGA